MKRAAKICAYPGCGEVTRNHFCEGHTPQAGGGDDRRGSSASRGYGSNWRKLRRIKLNQDPVCADPDGRHPGQVVAAMQVDHIIPLAQGGTNAMDNLQSLCYSCHSHKTATQDGGWGREGQISMAAKRETVRRGENFYVRDGEGG